MKQKLSILLAVVLPLSLFAGCTPADVPSTGDPSADASVTDSNVSDTSLSETDGVIFETNTDASTDSAMSGTVTDTSTDSESSQTSSESVVEKTTLTMEDFKTVVYGVTLRETTFDYLDHFFGKKGVNSGYSPQAYIWDFDNWELLCNYIRTDTIKTVFIVPPEGVRYGEVEGNEVLLALGVDSGEFVLEETDYVTDKQLRYTYVLPGGKKIAVVDYYVNGSYNIRGELIHELPELVAIYIAENT